MTKEQIQQFSNLVENETNNLIEKEFGFSGDRDQILYHFTSDHNANLITQSQNFWASFIRSTSDPLEFSLPLSYCRDWLCFGNNLFDFSASGFPANMFIHFNEQAIDPIARYYFISLTEDPHSPHHKQLYGKSTIEFHFGKPTPEIKEHLMILKCKYPSDMKMEVHRILLEWKTMFHRLIKEQKIASNQLPENAWFYMFMRLCHMCALCLKQDSFKDEKEVRIVLVPKKDDIDKGSSFYEKRATRPVSAGSLLVREYLPLKLTALAVKAKKAT
jgi:hypothetical protein